ncbi:thiaminase II [Motiliproteus coralliicola]|uniref:Aminopyrimidine aminohydrolase n=1 Tax=Motiliproteus coralliicola TaxID=2283196 RepID=A0A369WSE8_9GAMM|nr:thiaminase II [Motiliproteus coralliicola]RDE25028.1 thiaminase II [Motiliproteus coralliicola]
MNHRDLIAGCQQDWDHYIQHNFVKQLGQGTLDKASFQHYLQQDYLYLIHYARAFGLAVFKSANPAQMRASMPSLSALVEHELTLHIDYCKDWGLSEEDLVALPEGVATVAYTRYLIDAGLQGDLTDLYAALIPCALGYAEVGQYLTQPGNAVQAGNPYANWIDMYAGEEYQQAAYASVEFFDQLLAEIPADSERARQLQGHFTTATRMEIAFWQQGLDRSL